MLAATIVVVFIGLFLLMSVGIDINAGRDGIQIAILAGSFSTKLPIGKNVKTRKKKRARKTREKTPKRKKTGRLRAPFKKEEIIEIIKAALEALGRIRRHLSIDYLSINYIAASNDPYSAAMQYGYVNAALGAVLPAIETAFTVRESSINISIDFDTDSPIASVRLKATYQIWEIIYIGVAFGSSFLSMKYRMR